MNNNQLKQYLNSKDGFTLVEILVGSAIGVVVGALLVSFLVQNNGIFSQQTAVVSQGINNNDLNSEITESIRSSAAVVNQYPSVSPQYFSNDSGLVLTLPSINAQGVVIENVFDYLILSKDSTNAKILRKQIFPDASSSRQAENKVLSSKLLLLRFTYLDANNLIVSPTTSAKINFVINLSEKAGNSDKTSSASGQVNLRNN